ncbi:MAG: hypothetical protein KGO50_19335 [Myxococcales bacterium]|nr:hypothetical protein [Myxococcales bacterium]
MSNGLPNYGRYISRPSLAALKTETDGQRFPFPFALVTFADNTPPVLVFNQQVYQFLVPGDARRLVDQHGAVFVDAGPDSGAGATDFLAVQNASGGNPVVVQATSKSNENVNLLIGSSNSGLAALVTGDEKAGFIADSATGTRALRRVGTSGSTASVFALDRVAASGAKAAEDGGELQFRILDSNSPGNPFGSFPVTAAAIVARIHASDGSTSSLSFAIRGVADNVLVLNPSGATVKGTVMLDGIMYRSGLSTPYFGSDSASATSTVKSVTNGNVTASSIISVTPRSQLQGASVWWVEIPTGGGGFEVHFDAALGADWAFDYEIKRVS